MRRTVDARKRIEPNASKRINPNARNCFEQIASKQKEIARNQNTYAPNLKSHLDNLTIPSLNTPLGKSLRTDIENWTDTTTQPTIFHLKKSNGLGHIEPNPFPIGSLNSGIDVPISGRNIDNRTGMKP